MLECVVKFVIYSMMYIVNFAYTICNVKCEL